MTTFALCCCTNFINRPEKPMTWILGTSFSTSRAISTRSSSAKNGCLTRLSATARMRVSNSLEARRARSSWPSVIGSNVPGYTALLFILFPCQELKGHLPRPALSAALPSRGQFRLCAAFDINQRPGRQMRRQQRQQVRQIIGSEGRVEKNDVVAFPVASQEF